jgi:AraC family transcriptional regulator, regulatory protein of adaptative response / methylated-DNA-[protein]-cysteine methyltransferase
MKHAENQKALMPEEPVMRTAVANRDRRFDGAFVYGVLTTGVYCRPSCASRAANPTNDNHLAGLRAASCDATG